jgi:myo-inositol-1(or 4)-monophosphatase
VVAGAPRPVLVSELLELAVVLAREAGAELLLRFEAGGGGDVHSKSTPTDLVSDADLASESLLRGRLAEERPDDGFLGEEGEDHAGSNGLRWIVDPLDGTVNFLFGIPQWSVSVAVEEVASKRTLAGVIYDPCRDELWSAERDGPAALNGVHISGSNREQLATAMLATGLAYDALLRAAQAEVLAALIPRVRDIRRFGSAALDLAWTAAGRFDAFYERGVKLWDVAAGLLICERAGCSVRELAPAGELPSGVLVSAPALVDELYASVADQ